MQTQIETARHDAPGYRTLVAFEGWRVALMNDSPKTTVAGLTYLQKHNLSDEVFMLNRGRCVLILAGFGEQPGEISAVDMQPGTLYNIKKGVWHTHVFFENTQVVIVENADTGDGNSPKSDITDAQRNEIDRLCRTEKK